VLIQIRRASDPTPDLQFADISKRLTPGLKHLRLPRAPTVDSAVQFCSHFFRPKFSNCVVVFWLDMGAGGPPVPQFPTLVAPSSKLTVMEGYQRVEKMRHDKLRRRGKINV